jgi:hypothetical protein
VLVPIPPPTILSPLHRCTQDRKATSYTTSSPTYINEDVDHFVKCDAITPFWSRCCTDLDPMFFLNPGSELLELFLLKVEWVSRFNDYAHPFGPFCTQHL